MARTVRKRVARTSQGVGALAALAALSLGAQPARAQLGVEEIAIGAGLATGPPGPAWFFIIEVQGTALASGSVTPPVGPDIELTDAGGGGFELEFETGPFASFAALLAAHPVGDYRVTVNFTHAVTVVWNPTEPLGASGSPSLVIDSPADGATGVGAMPDVAYTLDCANCNDLHLELQSLAGATFSYGQMDTGSFTHPIPFAAMESRGDETELPPGPADAELLVGLVDFVPTSFDLPSQLPPFTYIEAAVLTADSTFTVPEPGGAMGLVAALAALGGLAGRRRCSG